MKLEKEVRFDVDTEGLSVKEFQYENNKSNGDWYMFIETLVETHTGLLVGRKIREFWTNKDLELFNGKDRIYESTTIYKDDIGYFVY